PSNIMVERTATGGLRPVIMDFGLARESGDSHGLTESGAVMGTPAYMSPEQARGEARRLDQRSDVYSLGATLYDVLLGKPPFEDQTVLNILLKVMNEPPTPLRQIKPDIPEAIELVVSKCLNKEPAQRYQTAKELADDLGRFLSAQKVEARRLSYSYRLSYWARNNRTLAALTFALLCSVIVGSGYGIRARFVAIQKERRAKEQSELSRRIGQSVKDIEWVARTAYLLPLHDASYEKQLVEQRMTEIETELSHHPEIGPRLLSYARGRGLLALHKWKESSAELRRAEQLGHVDLELDYAQGRALSALYSEALDEARKSGDRSFFEKRKAELDSELLKPALSYLERSRGLRTVSSTYVEGLIAFYQDRHDVALSRAEEAHKKAPWLYEAVQLAGDVFLTRARDQRDRGEHDQAEKSFAEAVARYRKAADIGRSDDSVYESLAETYIRWEELDYFRGRNPEDHLKEALAAADKALLAAK
ncbi:MAG TPA: serine/threonine-protein kinase, partial [Pseudomonadota bacterium]|nr:serine/threonine-protein kinase [Pseudomonadota bacterium]